ncbi:MAG: maltose-binding protein MalE, partial [Psychromonas sp.]
QSARRRHPTSHAVVIMVSASWRANKIAIKFMTRFIYANKTTGLMSYLQVSTPWSNFPVQK